MPDTTIRVRGDLERVAEAMSAIASAPRLTVLAYFEQSADRTATINELAEYVATRQGRPGGSTLHQVRLHLYHVDLPTLADAGVVEFDTDTGSVEYSETPFLSEQDASAEFVVRSEDG